MWRPRAAAPGEVGRGVDRFVAPAGFLAGDRGEGVAVDVELVARGAVEEPLHGQDVGLVDVVAHHLDAPELAQVVVALVGHGVVERGRGVGHLPVQVLRGVRAAVEVVLLGECPDQRVEGVGDLRPLGVRHGDGAGEPHRERVGDVPTGPPPEPPVDTELVVEGGPDQGGVDLPAEPPGPGQHRGQQPVAGEAVLLVLVCRENQTHRRSPFQAAVAAAQPGAGDHRPVRDAPGGHAGWPPDRQEGGRRRSSDAVG
ncbi:hypothetical protein ACFQV8_15230 [Pseudonocardia benzenivorans]